MANIDALMRAAKRKRIFPPRGHDPDYLPYDYGPPPPLPPMQKILMPDGPARHPVLGGGAAQHPFLPIYKPRRPRRS